MKLVNLDLEADIAIYRLVPEKGKIDPRFITTEALEALSSEYTGPVFSVGYASEDFTFERIQGIVIRNKFEETDQKFQDLGGDPEDSNIRFLDRQVARFRSLYTAFDFYRDRYLDRATSAEVRDLDKIKKEVSSNLY